MRVGVLLLTLLAVCSLTLVSAQDSFCVKYSKALFGVSSRSTNYQLLNAVVARVTVGCNNDPAQQFGVPGVAAATPPSPFSAYAPQACGNNGITAVPGLVSDPLNAPFFAGIAPNFQSFTNASKLNTAANVKTTGLTSIPFVFVNGTTRAVTPLAAALGGNTATGPSEGLVQHLISFFGIALGCDFNPTLNTNMANPATTAFIGKYNGVANMTAVHVGMGINWNVWQEFANTFILSLKSFGVAQADIDGTIQPYLNSFLRGPAGSDKVICNQADCPCAPQFTAVGNQCVVPSPPTFCQKYSAALFGASNRATNYQLLNAVVARVTVGCNNNLAQALGVNGVNGTIFAAYGPQRCGNNGITQVPGLVSDALNAPFFAGLAPAFQSFTNAAALNALFKDPPPAAGLSIPFVGVNGLAVTPFHATIGGNLGMNIPPEGLIQHLISFFGIALGCDVDILQNTNQVASATQTPFIGKYNGVVNMTAVHVGMAINNAVWQEFANTFIMSLKSFGVAQADILGTIQPYLDSFLRGPAGTSNVICNQPDCACAPQFTADLATGACVAKTNPPTFCQKYSTALFGSSTRQTNYQLLNAVVARVTVGCNTLSQAFGVPGVTNTVFAAYSPQTCGPNQYGITAVPGLVADPLNAPFFAGTASFTSFTNAVQLNTAANKGLANPAAGFPSVRFVGVNATTHQVLPFAATTGSGASEGLIQHLISFFGIALGCDVDMTQSTNQGTPAGTAPFIGKYNGVPSMTLVHKSMAINWAVWQEFANTFVLTLKSFGVQQADIDGTIQPYLNLFLRGPAGSDQIICNQPDCPCAAQFTLVGTQCVNPPTTPTPVQPTKPSFCSKYATNVFGADTAQTEYRLLQAVIARVILGCNNNLAAAFGVPGVAGTPELAAFNASICTDPLKAANNPNAILHVAGLVEDQLNAPFFNGIAPNYGSVSKGFDLNAAATPPVDQNNFNSLRFVTVTGQSVFPTPAALGGNIPFPATLGLPTTTTMFQEGLITHLIAFFGRDLGCIHIDAMHDTVTAPIAKAQIGRYNGATSMFQVHQNMKITRAVWDEFINSFAGALTSFGVTQEDITNIILPYVSGFLRGPTNGADMMICNQPDCLCAPQFGGPNGPCAMPGAGTGANANQGGTGNGAKLGAANGLVLSPIMVLATAAMAWLLA